MAVKKRPDFGSYTKRTVNKPASMDEFLKNGADAADPSPEKAPASEKPEVTKPKKPVSAPSIPEPEPRMSTSEPPATEVTTGTIEGQGAENDDNATLMDRLTFSTTVSFNPDIMDELEMLWFKLKRRVPAGKKKKFSKSLLINLMISNSIKEIDASDALAHPVVTALMQTIEE